MPAQFMHFFLKSRFLFAISAKDVCTFSYAEASEKARRWLRIQRDSQAAPVTI